PAPLLIYFSYSPRAHPVLHSFPTRRSSDLPTPEPTTRILPTTSSAASCSRVVPHRRSCRSPSRLKARDEHDRPPRAPRARCRRADRKSTRLNSSHLGISYAVFCLKKKKN